MFNLLIADDEELERRTIKKIITTFFADTFNVYEAKNGREAIEIGYRIKPDIIITDIKMPGINGLEAIKELRKNLKDTYFIILSAYDYFSYAKEAIENDVKEYILKPLKKDEFVEKVKKAVFNLEAKERERAKGIELKEKMFSLTPAIENELIYSIISHSLDSIDYPNYLKHMGVEFKAGYAMVIRLGSAFNEKDMPAHKMKVKDYIEEIIKGYHNTIISNKFTEDIIVFLEIEEIFDDFDVKLNALSLAKRLMAVVKEKLAQPMAVGIGKGYEGVENLSKSYDEAVAALQAAAADMRVKHYDDIVESAAQMSTMNSPNKVIISEQKVGESLLRNTNSISKEILVKAKDFMRKNYKRDITLEEVAEQVKVSSFYFSKLFKAETGMNYMDYLTYLRLEKAKEMLMEGVESIKTIGYEVGYNDPNYFSRVFKKVEGVTPSEYKSKI
jgi:two-component system, response regulator YesN